MLVRSPLAYAPRPGPLQGASAASASLYLGSFALVAFIYANPLILAATGAAVTIAGLLAGARSALASAWRWSLWLGVFIVAVNGIASQRGETILVRGWDLPLLGQIDISAEALAEGGVVGLRIAVVFAAFAVYSASVDPDRVLRLIRPFARHSALTATLIARLVPLAAADQARLREAALLRGPAAAEVGRAAMARRLVAGSLDRAVDIAATLELRGYARGVPRSGAGPRPGRHGRRFAAAALIVLALAITLRLSGAGGFEAYPTVSLDADAVTSAFAAALPLLAALPFAGTGGLRGRRRD